MTDLVSRRCEATSASRAGAPACTVGQLAKGRRNNFDVLRFLAATLVVISHSFPLTGHAKDPLEMMTGSQANLGKVGLAVFFIMSGFLVTKSFQERRTAGAYLSARCLRIFPALFVVVLLTAFLLGPLLTVLPLGEYLRSPGVYAYLRNCSLLHIQYDLPGLFQQNPLKGAVNGVLWTLPYEFSYYLMVLMLGLIGLYGKKGVILSFFCLGLMTAIVMAYHGYKAGRVANHLFLLPCFLSGMALWVWRDLIALRWTWAVLALLCLCASCWLGVLGQGIASFGAYLVVFLTFHPKLRLWGFGRFGDFSYGIYIYVSSAKFMG